MTASVRESVRADEIEVGDTIRMSADWTGMERNLRVTRRMAYRDDFGCARILLLCVGCGAPDSYHLRYRPDEPVLLFERAES